MTSAFAQYSVVNFCSFSVYLSILSVIYCRAAVAAVLVVPATGGAAVLRGRNLHLPQTESHNDRP